MLLLLLLLLSSHRDKGIFIPFACSVTVAYFVLVAVYLNKERERESKRAGRKREVER